MGSFIKVVFDCGAGGGTGVGHKGEKKIRRSSTIMLIVSKTNCQCELGA